MDKQAEPANANQVLQAELTGCQREVEVLRSELDLCTAILNAVSALVVVFDLQGHIVRCNRACEQTTGNCGDEVRNQPFWDLFLPQDDKESVKAVFEQIKLALTAIAHEHDWIAKNGSRLRIAWDYTPFLDASGSVKYVIGTGLDITSRKQTSSALHRLQEELEFRVQKRTAELTQANKWLQAKIIEHKRLEEELRVSETRFCALFEQSLQSIEIFAPDGRWLQGNQAWVELYGVTPEEFEPVNFNLLKDQQLVEKGVMPYVQKAFAAEATIVPPVLYDSSRNIKGGRERWAQSVIYPVKDEAGSIHEVVVMHQDITQLKQAELALQERAAQLEETNHLLSVRDRILSATASAANALLTIDNLDEAINTALQIIGESLDCDRVMVLEHFSSLSQQSSVCWKTLYEWDSPHAVPQISHPDLAQGSYEGIEEWYELLIRGQSISFLLEEMPEPFKSGQAELGVKALHTVPIFVEGKYWGTVGFDDCRKAKRCTDTEFAVLKTAGACIGSAIQRDRDRRAREAAERAVLLEREKAATERVAELAKANEALKRSLDALATEPSLDNFLGQVLSAIADQFQSPLAEYWYHPEDMAYVGMISWQGRIYNREEISALYPNHPGVAGFKVPPQMIHGEVLRYRKKYFVIDDWLSNPFVKHVKWIPENGVYKEINVPMVLGDDCIGALVVRMPRSYQITTQQIELAQALAHQATLAAKLTRLAEEAKLAAIAREQEKAAQERAAQLAKANDALKRSLDSLAQQPQLQAFLQRMVDEVAAQTGATQCHIFCYDSATHSLSLSVATENDGDWRSVPDMEFLKHPIPADSTPAWDIWVRSKEPYFLHEFQGSDDNLFWSGTLEWHHKRGHTRAIAIPLRLGDKALGALGLSFTEGATFIPEEVELVQALTQQATLAIELTRLAEQSRQEAAQTAVLSERNRMACELHDTLAQTLAGIVIRQEAAKRLLNAQCDSTAQWEKAQQHITYTLALAREGIAEARRSVWALRPGALEHADLCGAFRELLGRIAADTNLQTECQIQGTPFTLPPEVEGNLLRIGQEAINNALKYASANKLDVRLTFRPQEVRLLVQDDGQGFELNQQTTGGFGLISIRERARNIGARLSITSAPGQGTQVMVVLPMARSSLQLTTTEAPKDNEQVTRILIADDHPVVREGVAALLQQEPDMTVVAQASDGQQALELFRQHQPDIGLIDLRMPQMNGVETITAIRAEFPNARLVVLTTYDSDEDIYQGLRAGALGYLLKDVPREQLLECIRSVNTGQSYIPSLVGAKLAERIDAPVLSDREREVLCLMAVGKSNQEIGTALAIAQGTVKFHINKIMSKLQVNDRTQAVLVALRRGIANL